ncbi:hypothetical protein HpMS107_50070 [Helicobacter pylori]|mgnify:CR=1 FL=1|uniref:Uncharacterized protein n=1 Tax=Cupriavidus metallidurans TaxID=119219 RepID=A0A482ISG4_9BURK|nr:MULTISPECIES: hypothetical protein [Cupriavidus]QBP11778.1 hypothetical protein DDF84_018355 [Cupriavidus metallidurans]
MSRVVLVFSGPGEIPECDLQAIRRHAGVTVIDHRRSNALLLEVEGSASEFLADVGKMQNWIGSEQRTYRLT